MVLDFAVRFSCAMAQDSSCRKRNADQRLHLYRRSVCICGHGLMVRESVSSVAVTGITLLGYYPLREYYSLWMAAAAGGTIFGTGLYIRLRWR